MSIYLTSGDTKPAVFITGDASTAIYPRNPANRSLLIDWFADLLGLALELIPFSIAIDC